MSPRLPASVRVLHVLVLLSLLVTAIPPWAPEPLSPEAVSAAPQAVARQLTSDSLLAVAYTQDEPPGEPEPGLGLGLTVTPDPILVGETATFTLTVSNSGVPAEDLVVTLATPPGIVALPGDGTVSPTEGWQWAVGHLEPGSSVTLRGEFRVTRVPRGGTLFLQPQASARGRDVPAGIEGGALVFEPAPPGPAVARFEPGRETVLAGYDGRVEVRFPADAVSRPLTLEYRSRVAERSPAERAGPELRGLFAGLGTFSLEAFDEQNNPVHRFDRPVEIRVYYTAEQLEMRRLNESHLTLWWLDEAAGKWVPIPTEVDDVNQVASARVDHFSEFDLGDNLQLPAWYANVPLQSAWQVDLFTGAATYAYPIEVPAGPGGIKPALVLQYNSAQTDERQMRKRNQASWVGKGWTLGAGYITAKKDVIHNLANYQWAEHFTYALVLNGKTYDFGETPTGEWVAADEEFTKIRKVSNGSWSWNGTSVPREMWQVWTKDGTRYEFADDVWQAWDSTEHFFAHGEPYKWMLTRVVDTHGNAIHYFYDRDAIDTWLTNPNHSMYAECARYPYDVGKPNVQLHPNIWLTKISWGSNVNDSGYGQDGSADRYMVEFDSVRRNTYDPATGGGVTTPITLRTDIVVDSWKDMDWDFSGAQCGVSGPTDITRQQVAPHEDRVLRKILVKSKPSTTWELVRQYNLKHDFSQTSDLGRCTDDVNCDRDDPNWTTKEEYRKVTLLEIQTVGKDGSLFPTKTTFTYNGDRGVYEYPKGGFARLWTVDNGQGGEITFTYDDIGLVYMWAGKSWADRFANHHRLTNVQLEDGRGNAYNWGYAYGDAQVNSLGANNGDVGPNAYPNSARLYYGTQRGTKGDHLPLYKNNEFRGHPWVAVTDPNGNKVEHYFYQGDVGCTPTWTYNLTTYEFNSVPDNDTCWTQLRDREMLRGKEYQTIWKDAAGNKVKEVVNTYNVTFYSNNDGTFKYPQLYPNDTNAYDPYNYTHIYDPPNYRGPEYPDNGIWRSWVTLSSTEEKVYHPGDQSKLATRKTEYEYDPLTNHQIKAYQCSVYGQYGNVSKIKEYVNGSLYRQTERWYTYRDEVDATPPTYVVERLIQETVRDGSGNYLAWADYVYDEVPTASYTCGAKLGTKGELRLVRRYSNVEADPRNKTLYSQDTSYDYDNYGNRTVERIYQSPGRMWLNSDWSVTFYAAGDGSTSATTTTDYDTTFHAFPIKTTSAQPNWTSGTALVTEAGYDYRMGLLTWVKDPNGNYTYADYDQFGRRLKVWKPGDTETQPTVQFSYYDTEKPVRIRLDLREQSLTANVRTSYAFHDGLGRQIQTQGEGDGFYVVTDRKYDGLDQVTDGSVPHAGAGTFGAYTAPDGTVKWTNTTYNWAARPLVTTFPDSTKTEHHYGVYQDAQPGWITYDDLIDQNRHRIQYRYDPVGRLVKAIELSGDCGPY